MVETLCRWQKSGMAAKRFGEYIRIVEVLTPNTSPGQTERTIRMNATGRRFQCSVDMVTLTGLIDPNRLVEIKASPTSRSKKSKATISELILRHHTKEDKPIFLSVTRKFNSPDFEACYIKLYGKQAYDFGECPAGYLSHFYPEAQDEIYKAFSPSAVDEAENAIWDEEAGRIITQLEREQTDDINQVANQEWLAIDESSISCKTSRTEKSRLWRGRKYGIRWTDF